MGKGIGAVSPNLLESKVGVLGEKMWVGDESLILNEASKYTATVLSDKVRVLEISKKDFIEKFPTDIKRYLYESIMEK